MSKEVSKVINVSPEVVSYRNRLSASSDFKVLARPKLSISKVIVQELKEQNYSVRSFAEKIGMKHPQIIRVTGGKNYNIDTLLKILDGLGLEIIIKEKEDINNET